MTKGNILGVGVLFITLFFCNACSETNEKKEKSKENTEFKYERKTKWTEKDMEFQMNYCFQIVGTVDDLDKPGYCKCFLDKVKFYYERSLSPTERLFSDYNRFGLFIIAFLAIISDSNKSAYNRL